MNHDEQGDAGLIREAREHACLYGGPSWAEATSDLITRLAAALEERGTQLEQALRERSPCRKCSGRGYTLAYDGITRKQCESCNGTKMELRLVDHLDAVRALSQRQAETIETLRTDLADVEANAEAYKAQRDRLRAMAREIEQIILPDPYDERETDRGWMRDRIRAAIDAALTAEGQRGET